MRSSFFFQLHPAIKLGRVLSVPTVRLWFRPSVCCPSLQTTSSREHSVLWGHLSIFACSLVMYQYCDDDDYNDDDSLQKWIRVLLFIKHVTSIITWREIIIFYGITFLIWYWWCIYVPLFRTLNTKTNTGIRVMCEIRFLNAYLL